MYKLLYNPRCRKSREAMEFLKFKNLNHANYKGYMIDNSILKNALLKTVKKNMAQEPGLL